MQFLEKHHVHAKQFFTLWIASLIGFFSALPYGLELQQETLQTTDNSIPVLIGVQFLTTFILYAILIFLGLKVLPQTPFKLSIINTPLSKELKKHILSSAAWGTLAFVLIILVSQLFNTTMGDLSYLEQKTPAIWKGFLASFYGAINEEILLRLVVMTLITSGILKFKFLQTEKWKSIIIWFSILVSAFIFGLGHLPAVKGMGLDLDVFIIIRILIPNMIGGIIFGFIYWKKGLEYAMISHFTTDILLHCVLPFFK